MKNIFLTQKSKAVNLLKNWSWEKYFPITSYVMCEWPIFWQNKKLLQQNLFAVSSFFAPSPSNSFQGILLHCQDSQSEKPFLLSEEHLPDLKYIVVWRCRSNRVTKILVYFFNICFSRFKTFWKRCCLVGASSER